MSEGITVVLVGAGHTHLYVAARAAALAGYGARVVLIDPGQLWHAGRGTGTLSARYAELEDQISPQALIQSRGGEFVRDTVTRIDAGTRSVHLAGGGTIAYDRLSLNVGTEVDPGSVAGAADDNVIPARPAANLWPLRKALESRFASGATPRVVVVGGGQTGAEVAANLLGLASRNEATIQVVLLTRGARLAPSLPGGASRALARGLAARGAEIRTGTGVIAREEAAVVTNAGDRVEADFVVLATGLRAAPPVQEIGLPSDPAKGLRVNARLHSVADERVFACGDCALLEGRRTPRLGVFDAQQASYLFWNLLASVRDDLLREYRSPRRRLSVLDLGNDRGLATWGRLWWQGRSALRLRRKIDGRFLEDPREIARYGMRGQGSR